MKKSKKNILNIPPNKKLNFSAVFFRRVLVFLSPYDDGIDLFQVQVLSPLFPDICSDETFNDI
jgi:hypothetical protein